MNKRLKKWVAGATVALSLMSFVAPAGAATFSDLKDATQTKDIYRLNSLGIINGYEDGTFKPDGNITRAEFAVIAMSAAGLKNSADVLKNSTPKFKDVKKGDWYTGWVNLAASQGYIAGYPDGSFKPNNNITNAECLTILTRILGYNENLPGVWPTEYIVKAAELGITDDVKVDASAPAKRGDIAVMASATLDEDLMTWDKDKEQFTNKYDAAKTLFEDKFDGYTYDEDGLKVTAWGMNSDNQYTITVQSLNKDNPATPAIESDWADTKTYTLAKNVVLNGVATVADLKNNLVEFNYNTDDKEITYVNVTSKSVKGYESADSALDSIKDATDTGIKVNDVQYSYAKGYSVPVTKFASSEGYFKFLLDKDGDIYGVSKFNDAGDYQVVDEYNTTSQKLSFKNSIGSGTGTLELKDKDVLVVKDGKIVKPEDIKENDVVKVDTTISGLDYYIEVKTLKSGKVEGFYGGSPYTGIKIGGTKYALRDTAALISTDNGDNYAGYTNTKLDDVYNVDVKYLLDSQNHVALILSDKEAADNKQYGILTEVTDESLAGKVTGVKILKSDNTEAQYSINTDEWVLDVDDPGNASVSPATPSDIDETVVSYAPDAFVSYTLDANGKIDELKVLDDVKNLDDAVKDSNKIYVEGTGWFYLDSNTKIMNGREGDDAATETNSNLLKYLEDHGTNANLSAYIKTDGNKVEYILINKDLGVTADDKGMVTDRYTKDGKLWIDVDVRGTATSYEAASGETYAGVSDDTLYSYTMSGSKIDLGDAVSTGIMTASEVYEKDTTHNSIRVNNSGSWFEVDKDTYIYDLTGTTPKFVKDLSGISVGDNIKYVVMPASQAAYDATPTAYASNYDADRVGVIDVLYIVD